MRVINIVGYEGLYAVTDEGQIYSLKQGIQLKPAMNAGGYLIVSLNKDGVKHTVPIHKAVYYSFNSYRKLTRTDLLVIDHIDGDRTNNRLDNLRKITTRENTSRAKTNMYGKGVHYFKNIDKYGAEITINGTRYHLGTFLTPQEASEHYYAALSAYNENGNLPVKKDKSVKYCKQCGTTKPISEFYYIKGHGYQTLCKECQRAQSKLYREKLKAKTSS